MDVTLDSCCQRDKEDKAKFARKLKILNENDRSMQNIRRFDNVVQYPKGCIDVCDNDDDDSFLDCPEFIQQQRNAFAKRCGLKDSGNRNEATKAEGKVYSVNSHTFKRMDHTVQVVVLHGGDMDVSCIRRGLEILKEKYGTAKFYLVLVNEREDLFLNVSYRQWPMLMILADNVTPNGLQLKRYNSLDVVYEMTPWMEHYENVLLIEKELPDAENEDDDHDTGYDCGRQNCRIRYAYYHQHIGPNALNEHSNGQLINE